VGASVGRRRSGMWQLICKGKGSFTKGERKRVRAQLLRKNFGRQLGVKRKASSGREKERRKRGHSPDDAKVQQKRSEEESAAR